MARDAPAHRCTECNHPSPQWHGRCPACGAWGTLTPERQASHLRGAPAAGRAGGDGSSQAPVPRPLREIGAMASTRLSTGIGELDRVLGGGLVPGSLVLLGGSPGIGKSTLTNMALGNLANAGRSTLYVSGEESAEQVRLRAQRLGPGALEVPVLAETDLDAVLDTLAAHRPQVCVIDSVQTLRRGDGPGPGRGGTRSAPGGAGQVREVTGRIMELAKLQQIAVVLVGHVTKDGALAGPRVLEHLVDCVLQFEGERERPYRELRALKNRFGSTSEAGLFEMRQGGLVEVLDASARFVAGATCAPGSVVLAAMEGSRPLLVEVQALVSRSELEQPRRLVSGLDRNRLALILAILGRHGGVALGGADVFVNVVGGVRVEEPGCDLAIALAVASAARGTPIAGRPCAESAHRLGATGRAGDIAAAPRACFGELGLTGELRWVGHPERRLQEAARHRLADTIAPPGSGAGAREVATLHEALAAAFAPGGHASEQIGAAALVA
jgi:DNA repair protein RadA/Sms